MKYSKLMILVLLLGLTVLKNRPQHAVVAEEEDQEKSQLEKLAKDYTNAAGNKDDLLRVIDDIVGCKFEYPPSTSIPISSRNNVRNTVTVQMQARIVRVYHGGLRPVATEYLPLNVTSVQVGLGNSEISKGTAHVKINADCATIEFSFVEIENKQKWSLVETLVIFDIPSSRVTESSAEYDRSYVLCRVDSLHLQFEKKNLYHCFRDQTHPCSFPQFDEKPQVSYELMIESMILGINDPLYNDPLRDGVEDCENRTDIRRQLHYIGYWLCVGGYPRLQRCPAGLAVNPTSLKCELGPTVPGCSEPTPTTTPAEEETSEGSSGNGNAPAASNQEGGQGGQQPRPSQAFPTPFKPPTQATRVVG